LASYVIGDTHGCLLTLRHLVENIISFSKSDTLYLLGDYIDRGPLSAQLLDYLIYLVDDGYSIFPLRGNHEQLMLDAVNSSLHFPLWIQNMGNSTIESYKKMYGVNFSFPENIPNMHLSFLRKLDFFTIVDRKFILVHGGINYSSENPFADSTAMLWTRADTVPENFMPGYTIIHGHTPTSLQTLMEKISEKESRLIPLDTGCVYKGKLSGCGYLAALKLNDMSLLFCENKDF